MIIFPYLDKSTQDAILARQQGHGGWTTMQRSALSMATTKQG
jgi:hypothetical protein